MVNAIIDADQVPKDVSEPVVPDANTELVETSQEQMQDMIGTGEKEY